MDVHEDSAWRARRLAVLVSVLVLLAGVLVVVAEVPASGTVPGSNGKIAYIKDGDLWTMDANGDNQALLRSAGGGIFGAPSWSPDGTRIAVEACVLGCAIAVVSADGATLDVLTSSAVSDFDPAWSPDGTKIAYITQNRLWWMDANGDNQAILLSAFDSQEPAWSPDGSKIAATSCTAIHGCDIVVISDLGSPATITRTNLTNTSGVDERNPAWTPDGSIIGYDREGDIWSHSLSIGFPIPIARPAIPDSHVVVSPNGAKAAFQTAPTGNWEIFIYDLATLSGQQVTNTPEDETEPAWQTIYLPPVAVADGPYSVAEGGTLDRAAPGVLANDTDPEADPLTAVKVTDPAHGTLNLDADGSFTYVHDGSDTTSDSFTYKANDGTADSNVATVTIAVTPVDDSPVGHTVGLVDPSQGRWRLRNSTGVVSSFFYGNPNDIPFMGDWDCDGDDTPGLFRQSDAFAYLRNANTVGIADIRFFFGNPSDVPLAGDFDGDGCDTLSIYRPSEQRFYIINRLGENEGGLGGADYSFLFGNPGDKPVVGDWDGDGIDEVGLHRESTGFFYYRNSLDTGIADALFFFGDPDDRFVAGDWGTIDGVETPAVFRPSNTTFYLRHTNTPGVADSEFVWGETPWLPVAGAFGLD